MIHSRFQSATPGQNRREADIGGIGVFDLGYCPRDEIVEVTARQATQRTDRGDWMLRGKSAFGKKRLSDARFAFQSVVAFFPYDSEGWLWLSRVAGAEKQPVLAEIACRTACAYGASINEGLEVLNTALGESNRDDDFPRLRQYRRGPTAGQVPGRPDILLLASVAWGERPPKDDEVLFYLRHCGTLDEAFARMIVDPRFSSGNREWLSVQSPRMI